MSIFSKPAIFSTSFHGIVFLFFGTKTSFEGAIFFVSFSFFFLLFCTSFCGVLFCIFLICDTSFQMVLADFFINIY